MHYYSFCDTSYKWAYIFHRTVSTVPAFINCWESLGRSFLTEYLANYFSCHACSKLYFTTSDVSQNHTSNRLHPSMLPLPVRNATIQHSNSRNKMKWDLYPLISFYLTLHASQYIINCGLLHTEMKLADCEIIFNDSSVCLRSYATTARKRFSVNGHGRPTTVDRSDIHGCCSVDLLAEMMRWELRSWMTSNNRDATTCSQILVTTTYAAWRDSSRVWVAPPHVVLTQCTDWMQQCISHNQLQRHTNTSDEGS